MKNNIIGEKKSRIGFIFDKIKGLPYFAIDDLASVETDKVYLRILLARYCKAGKLIRLKKGYYVADEYLKNLVSQNGYGQFVANLLCSPSYLSLDYVLNQCGILTEMPVNFISVAKEKQFRFLTGWEISFIIKSGRICFAGLKQLKKTALRLIVQQKRKLFLIICILKKSILSAANPSKNWGLMFFTGRQRQKRIARIYWYGKIKKNERNLRLDFKLKNTYNQ